MIKIFDYSNNLGSPLQSALSQSGKAVDKTVRRLRTDEYKCTRLLSEIKKKMHIFLISPVIRTRSAGGCPSN